MICGKSWKKHSDCSDPQAWLADVFSRIADKPIIRLEQLLPWNWISQTVDAQARDRRPSPAAYVAGHV
jgi:hypothetical protein